MSATGAHLVGATHASPARGNGHTQSEGDACVAPIGRRALDNTPIDIGPLDSIAPGQGRAFVIAGRTIAVFRQRDGRVFATDNQCPHRGGPLAEGIVGDGKVICPLHNWKIDLATGQCLGESATLRTYPVSVVNGRVFVNAECGVLNAE
ncbi:MAG: nitrite reductase small subunit NirD [Deltaproteobacteria bacterium]|nr:nitrite reductase small subunit NirD [Deltaproteobacteria bacterium]MBI3389563.1 nitrite reductase small subunit NirD [Deltaproteobacteria bacterium]